MSERSFDDIRRLLDGALAQRYKALGLAPGYSYDSDCPTIDWWIRDIYPEYFVYSVGLAGMFKSTYAIDDNDIVTLGDPQAVKEETTYEPVKASAFSLPTASFSAGAGFDDEVVIKRGKIFEAGNFPDKKFSLSLDEMQDAVKNFRPVPLDDGHYDDSVFNGKLGYLQKIEMGQGDEAGNLYGTVAMPKSLNTLLGDSPIKVSCTWDRGSKKLLSLALVTRPRVADAALMSKFSQERLDQEYKRVAAFVGARNSASDMTAIQAIHDNAAKLGANCDPDGDGDNDASGKADYSAQTPTPVPTPTTNPQTQTTFNKETISKMPENNNQAAPVQQDPAVAAELSRMQAELAEFKAATERMEGERCREQAVAFASEQISANRAVPAQRGLLTALFEQAAKDDAGRAASAVVVFDATTATKGEPLSVPMNSRVEALKALFSQMPGHNLTQELIAAHAGGNGKDKQNLTALFDKESNRSTVAADADVTTEVDQEEYERTLSKTPQGREILKRQKAGN